MRDTTASEPRRWRSQRWIWGLAIALVLITTLAKAYKIQESKALRFDKVKESRRGTIRLAKERKENLLFTQEREGVSRNLWIQDPAGPRRQFFLEAVSALVSTSVTSKTHSLVESDVIASHFARLFCCQNIADSQKAINNLTQERGFLPPLKGWISTSSI